MSSKAVMSLRKQERPSSEAKGAGQGGAGSQQRERVVDGEVERFGEESTWVGKYI
jgi:hypothetical protein